MDTGLRVATVGGGPAGSLFALFLAKYAREQGLALEVDIYEPRDFAHAGPPGCNRCAGILSGRFLDNIRELGLNIPQTVVQSRINTYSVISPFGTIEVANPEPDREIFSIYRGGGPLRAPIPGEQSFDLFLLEEARRRGARCLRRRVKEIRLHPQPAVLSAEGWEAYDLVALCTGVNSPPIPIEGVPYSRPPTLRMSQDELMARPEDVANHFGHRVKVFILPSSPLIFGTLVPKGSRINVSLLGEGGPPSVSDFLAHPLVARELPFPYRRVCGCRPLISVGRALHPYADGFVAVGDSSVTHLYKDGIGSALLTARQAARTAVYRGVSAQSFHRHYAPFLASLQRDNAYGRLLFGTHQMLKRRSAFFLAHGELARQERQTAARHRPFNQVLWDLFTGSHSYSHILRMGLAPSFFVRLLAQAAAKGWRPASSEHPVRIVVAGGGFGGVYTVLRLEKALGQMPGVEIILVSRENFFLFLPLLHEVATGGIETRHISLPIRALRGRRHFRFLSAELLSVDLHRKHLVTDQGEIDYDYLVLALGGVPDTGDATGAGHTITLKTLYDGIYLRNHIIQLLEAADSNPHRQEELLTLAVVGGGAVGVQLVAEMRDFIFRSLITKYSNVDPSRIKLLLVNPELRLLEDMDPKIASYSLALLRKKDIKVRLGSRVTRVWDGAMELDGRETIPTQTVVWAGGIRANPVVASLPVGKDEEGRVIVDRYLGVPGFPGVYALGDNAHFANSASGKPLPARAHIAVRQPPTVVHNIAADLTGGRRKPFATPWMADIVSLGSHSAAFKVFGLRIYGFPARALWLASYLALLPRNYNRVRVVVDWLLSLFFGRDTTLLRLSTPWLPSRATGAGPGERPSPPPTADKTITPSPPGRGPG
ncbi:MAG: FAD-dependent oxidoreductase [Chloroflexi bacterium]|nr:FAD-dependent oxidoreductase [Chloroflexota bacterium]